MVDHWRRRGAAAVSALLIMAAAPVRAFSALGAWRINADGLLELRTSPYTNLKASFDAGGGDRGPRLWIDLPGTPSRPRNISGSGVIRQVRIGAPEPGITRFVIEFVPGVQLDPSQLKLVGVGRDSWKLQFPNLQGGFVSFGEGNVDRVDPVVPSLIPGVEPQPSPRLPLRTLRTSDLPQVNRGRFRVVIDPGHGGPDPGAIGIGGTQEKDVVLEISLQVAELLRSRGVEALLTRNGDIDVDLPPRVQFANSSGADAFVSIHANALSMSRPDVNGLETFYFQSLQGRNLANSIHASLLQTVRRIDRGVKEGRFYVIRATRMPSTLVEVGFLTGADDAADLVDPAHRRQIALAIAVGILDYLRLAG
jgi:N-acetylmuramoyl-L-alanine amidase